MMPDDAAAPSDHPLQDKSLDATAGPVKTGPVAANAYRLLWAGFMAIMASGVGFSIRAGILGQWAEQYGFTQTELGAITGGGLTGFGIIILLSALIADKIGYGTLMISAFVMHLLSAALTLATGAAYASGGKPAAFQCLFWGMFLFAVGNGIAEAVVNPLVATLFPKEKTHFLNILHAGWPGGLVVGGIIAFVFTGESLFGWKPLEKALPWQYQISFFLVPVALYGLMLLGQRFPKSEASQQGVSYKNMLRELGMPGAAIICALLGLFLQGVCKDLGWSPYVGWGGAGVLWVAFTIATGFHFGSILLAVLLFAHALVGYVELGTDSWISKITGAIMASKQAGLGLLVYTSTLMFILRFFAGPIVEKTSPLGLLCASGVLGATGLTLLGNSEGMLASVWYCVIAATVYACGKTFLWPTMLAVASEQFPRGGAITIGAVGGVGMLSAGLLGGPGIGFQQDHYASESLKTADSAVYERYRAPTENEFLTLKTVGLDGAKVGVLEDEGKEAIRALDVLKKDSKATSEAIANQEKLVEWWNQAKLTAAKDKPLVTNAGLYGGRMALKWTAVVPLTMALIYFCMILYFKSKGGYRAKELISKHEEAMLMVGGVAGPAEF
jgi:MFS family permease